MGFPTDLVTNKALLREWRPLYGSRCGSCLTKNKGNGVSMREIW